MDRPTSPRHRRSRPTSPFRARHARRPWLESLEGRTVLTATSINLTANAAALVYGQSETLTATVTAAGSTPTGGTVTFLDGGKAIGTAALSGGTAALTTSPLAVGQHLFTASYGGAGSYAPSSFSSQQTTVATGLNQVTGVAVDGKGDMYVADTSNNRVLEFVRRRHVADRRLGAEPTRRRRGGRQWRRVHRRLGQQPRRRGQAQRRGVYRPRVGVELPPERGGRR